MAERHELGHGARCARADCTVRQGNENVSIKLLQCSGCLHVTYCSTDCQKADWSAHKLLCAALKDDPNIMSNKDFLKAFRTAHQVFHGDGLPSKRIILREFSENDVDSQQVLKFAESLDLERCVLYGIKKFCETSLKGAVIYDADRPNGMSTSVVWYNYCWVTYSAIKSTSHPLLQHIVQGYDPRLTVCILYYKLAPDMKSVNIWHHKVDYELPPEAKEHKMLDETFKKIEAGGGEPLDTYQIIYDPKDPMGAYVEDLLNERRKNSSNPPKNKSNRSTRRNTR